MRSKNPEVMNAICTFVDQYYRENHVSPSVNEIAQGVGVSKATSYRYLVAMNERGMLSYDGKTIVTKQVGKCTSGYFSAPVVGSIRCGDPEREEESVEEYVFWAVTGAVGLLISALAFFVKRGMDKKDTRDKEQDKRITEVEDKLNNTINQMPFLYTLREDFIRSSAQQTQKLDQIITLLMKREEK